MNEMKFFLIKCWATLTQQRHKVSRTPEARNVKLMDTVDTNSLLWSEVGQTSETSEKQQQL